jgi:PAS domain S-box-containing protein
MKGAPLQARILLLENDPGHAELVRRAFAESNKPCEFVPAVTLAQAKDRLASTSVDLILADLMLPDGRGTELLSEFDRRIPLVVMTSHGSETIAVEAIKAGALDYVVKSPEGFASIPQIVQRALREWTLINEKQEAERSLLEAKQDWEGIFHSIGHSAMILDPEHRILAVNQAVKELTRLDDSALVGCRCAEIFHEDGQPPPNCPVEEILASGKKMVEKEIEALGRSFIVTCTPILSDNGAIQKIIHLAMDVTEKRKMEERLNENREKYRNLFELSPAAIILFNLKGKVVECNALALRLTDAIRQPLLDQSMETFDFLGLRTKNRLIHDFAQIMEGKPIRPIEFEYTYGRSSRWFEITLAMFKKDGGNWIVQAVIRDVTVRKKAEERLRESEERLRQIIRQMPNPVEIFGPDGTLSMVNQAYLESFGIRSEESVIDQANILSDPLMKTLGIAETIQKAFRGETVFIPEIKFPTHPEIKADNQAKTGLIRELTLFPVFRKKGEIWRVVAIWNDITERKRIDTRMKKLLKEQKVMLQEIHHRVKNNLQIISSLHRLQSRKFEDPVILKSFTDTQNRIHSMSLIHEQLYRSNDFAKIDFSEYIQQLVRSLIRSHGVDVGRIEFSIDVRNVSLPMELAIPCGLVVNEIVTNALKYAFPDRVKTKGRIEIKMAPASQGWVELTIGDNGIGLPKKLDVAKTESLGLHLVHLLIEEQLQGKIEVSRERGTRFRILFNRKFPERIIGSSGRKSGKG